MPEPNHDSLPHIAQYAKEAVLRQLAEADTIASRGYQLAGFATAVMGVVAIGDGDVDWLLGAIIAVYLLALIACCFVVIPREYTTSGSPKGVWHSNYASTPNELWHAIVHSSVEAYESNQTVTLRRTKALFLALGCLAIQTALVGVHLL